MNKIIYFTIDNQRNPWPRFQNKVFTHMTITSNHEWDLSVLNILIYNVVIPFKIYETFSSNFGKHWVTLFDKCLFAENKYLLSG